MSGDGLTEDDRPSRAELSADAHEEAREAAAIALWEYAKREWHWGGAEREGCENAASVAIDAYLEALNAH